jgi:hypothetical protein
VLGPAPQRRPVSNDQGENRMLISRARSGARILGLVLAAFAIAVPAAQAATPDDVPVQLLGINDFHGNLEPPTGSGGRIQEVPFGPQIDAGGAVFLANQLRTLREQNPNTLTVSAGDLIGASPLLSALFHDEPTIEAMNEMGLDLNAVGNHEFDEGVMELLRMQNGGCGPDNSCPGGPSAEPTSSSSRRTWSTRTRANRSSRPTPSGSSTTSRSASSG